MWGAAGLEPVDLLLVMAAAENDAPKVGELLRAGADTHVKVSAPRPGGPSCSAEDKLVATATGQNTACRKGRGAVCLLRHLGYVSQEYP